MQGKPFSFELLRAIVGCRLIFFNNLLPLFGRGIDVAYQVHHIFIIFGLKLHQLVLVLLESFQIVIDLLELLLCFFQLVFQCAITCLPGEGYSHASLIFRVLIGCDESRLRAYLACYGHRLHRRIEGLGVALLICRNGINLQRALAFERIVGHGVVLVIVAAPGLFGVLLYLNDDISAVDAVDVNHLSQLDGNESGAHVDADYLPLLRHFKGVDVAVVVELGPACLGERRELHGLLVVVLLCFLLVWIQMGLLLLFVDVLHLSECLQIEYAFLDDNLSEQAHNAGIASALFA